MGTTPTPTPAPATVPKLVKVDEILTTIDSVTQVAEAFPVVGTYAALADSLIKIVQSALRAHLAATGQPMDLTKIHSIDPIP